MFSAFVPTVLLVSLLCPAMAGPNSGGMAQPGSLSSQVFDKRSDFDSQYNSQQRQYDPYAQQYTQAQARGEPTFQDYFAQSRFDQPSQYAAKNDFENMYGQRDTPSYYPYDYQARSPYSPMFQPDVGGYSPQTQARSVQSSMEVPSVSQRNLGYGAGQVNSYTSRSDDYQPQYAKRDDEYGQQQTFESDPSMMGRESFMPQNDPYNAQGRSMDDPMMMGMSGGMMDPMQQQMQMSQRQYQNLQNRDDNVKAQRAFQNNPYAVRDDENPIFMTRDDNGYAAARQDFQDIDYKTKRDEDDDAARQEYNFQGGQRDDDDDSARQDYQGMASQGQRDEGDDESVGQRDDYSKIVQRAADAMTKLFPRSTYSDQADGYNAVRSEDPMQMMYDYMQRNYNPNGGSPYNYRSYGY